MPVTQVIDLSANNCVENYLLIVSVLELAPTLCNGKPIGPDVLEGIHLVTSKSFADSASRGPLICVIFHLAAVQTKCAAQPSNNGTGFDTALNPCVAAVRPSKTMLLSDLASSLRDSGVDVVSLAAGEPDFDTPQEIIDAGIEALRYERTHRMPLCI